MSDARTLLLQPHLTIVSGEPDFDLRQIAQVVTHSVMVDGRAALDGLLSRLVLEGARAAQVAPKTLDLIGHTRSSASLVSLGGWTIDAADPATIAWARGLAGAEVLPRLGVHALRLLGCGSAATPRSRETIARLADSLGVEVYGTTQLLSATCYDAAGFRDCWRFLLVAASDLRRAGAARADPAADPHPRVLDLDALPAVALGPPGRPRRVASAQAARQILQLVRRLEGARIPGLAAAPACELALPAATPGAYHITHLLLDGQFLQFYPDGMAATGVAFPVADASALRRVVATLGPGPVLTR